MKLKFSIIKCIDNENCNFNYKFTWYMYLTNLSKYHTYWKQLKTM